MKVDYPGECGRFVTADVPNHINPNDYHDCRKHEINYPGVPGDEDKQTAARSRKAQPQVLAVPSSGFYFRAEIHSREKLMDDNFCRLKAAELFHQLYQQMPARVFYFFVLLCVQYLKNQIALRKSKGPKERIHDESNGNART